MSRIDITVWPDEGRVDAHAHGDEHGDGVPMSLVIGGEHWDQASAALALLGRKVREGMLEATTLSLPDGWTLKIETRGESSVFADDAELNIQALCPPEMTSDGRGRGSVLFHAPWSVDDRWSAKPIGIASLREGMGYTMQSAFDDTFGDGPYPDCEECGHPAERHRGSRGICDECDDGLGRSGHLYKLPAPAVSSSTENGDKE